ncbi:MAG: ribonuclease D [Deltaproteobacteria bacterium]|nr:MAG: ribonuclease D [Deltaproteobacteria bacterium]
MTEKEILITTEKDLAELCQEAQKTDVIALDTEFVWEKTFYPRLGLIQMALSDERCYLIDPLSIQDLRALGTVLKDRRVMKILHDAPQDLAILHRATGVAAQNVFDTRLAAGFASLPATLSLAHLVKGLLDIDLVKDATRTNWLKRPFSKAQVQYALDDVRYLRAVRVILLSRMIGPQIKSWLQEELNLLNNPATYDIFNEKDRFRRIAGSSKLDRPGLAILRDLALWRNKVAQEKDRPRGHIVADKYLVEIARTRPNDETTLQKTRLPEKAMCRYGKDILKVVSTALAEDKSTYPRQKERVRLNKQQQSFLENLDGSISLKCELLGIDPSLLGNKNEFKQLAKTLLTEGGAAGIQTRQMSGWRKDFLKGFFSDLPEK